MLFIDSLSLVIIDVDVDIVADADADADIDASLDVALLPQLVVDVKTSLIFLLVRGRGEKVVLNDID